MCTKDVAKCEVYSLVVCIKLFFSLVGKCAVELFGGNSCLTILDGKATGVIHLFDLRNRRVIRIRVLKLECIVIQSVLEIVNR